MKALRELANGTVRPLYSISDKSSSVTALQLKYPDSGTLLLPTTVRKQAASTLREIVIPLYSAIARQCLEDGIHFCAPPYKGTAAISVEGHRAGLGAGAQDE